MDPAEIEKWSALAKQHPVTTAVIVGALLGAFLSFIGLVFIGLVAGLVDDSKFESPRMRALVRIGQRVGVVFRGCGADLVILVTGEERLLKPEDKPGA